MSEKTVETEEEQGGSERVIDPVPVGSLIKPQGLLEEIRRRREEQAKHIHELGGPQAYLQALVPVFSQRRLVSEIQPTLALALSRSPAAWEEIEAREGLCAKCPPEGGTCEGADPYTKGRAVERLADDEVGFAPCSKWKDYTATQKLVRAGVPLPLAQVKLRDLITRDHSYPLRVVLEQWMLAIAKKEPTPPLILTGGRFQVRTSLAIAIARIACRVLKVNYTFGPKLSKELVAYYKTDRSDEGPVDRIMQSDLFLFDFFDPIPPGREPWSEWFMEEVDQILMKWIGGGRATILATRHSHAEVMQYFPYVSMLPMLEISIDSPDFGPLRV